MADVGRGPCSAESRLVTYVGSEPILGLARAPISVRVGRPVGGGPPGVAPEVRLVVVCESMCRRLHGCILSA